MMSYAFNLRKLLDAFLSEILGNASQISLFFLCKRGNSVKDRSFPVNSAGKQNHPFCFCAHALAVERALA